VPIFTCCVDEGHLYDKCGLNEDLLCPTMMMIGVTVVKQAGRESLKKCTSLDNVKTSNDLGRPHSNMETGTSSN